MTIKPEEITASLRRMADVETSVLYSQRTTLIGAADEIERLQAEVDRLQRLFTQAGEQLHECRKELAGSDENTLLMHLAYIRQKSGVGMKPMLNELADAIAEKIARTRNYALDEASAVMDKRAMQGRGIEASACYRNASAAIRALKDDAT